MNCLSQSWKLYLTETMKFKLEINMDNSAFEDAGTELARILTRAVERLRDLSDFNEFTKRSPGVLRDINGNAVGQLYFVKE